MSDQNSYYPNNPQDPYSGGQYGGDQNQYQPPQTVYGSYDNLQQPPPYQPTPQPQYYQPAQNPGYGQQQGAYPGTPYMVPAPTGQRNGLVIAGFVLGIVSLVLFWTIYIGIPAAIVGIILSVLGRSSTQRRTMATIGLVLSIVAIVLALCEVGLGLYGLSHRS